RRARDRQTTWLPAALITVHDARGSALQIDRDTRSRRTLEIRVEEHVTGYDRAQWQFDWIRSSLDPACQHGRALVADGLEVDGAGPWTGDRVASALAGDHQHADSEQQER